MEETKILEINKENKDLNNLLKHIDEVSNLKSKILQRFENDKSIKSSKLKEEIGQSIALTKICDEELILQFMKLFFKFEKDEIPRKIFEDNLEGFLTNSYTFKIAKPNRSTEDLKAIGFEYAKNYIKSFTNHKNTKISLVSFEKPSPQNNFISKFLFVEHKEDVHIENLQKASPNKENGLVFFKVCVPENSNNKSFLDIFCPFSTCTKYEQFLDSKLSCLSDLKPEVRSSIEEINKFAKN